MSLYINGASFSASFRAPFTASGLKKPSSGSLPSGFLLLADGSSFFLLADGTSKLKL